MTAPAPAGLSYVFREAEPKDANFVVKAWVKEMRHAPWTRHVPNHIYVHAQHELVHRAIASSRVTLACDEGNPDLLFGCVVHGPLGPFPNVLHWVYVKGAYRGIGLAHMLLDAAGFEHGQPVICTQASSIFDGDRGRALVERYQIVYSPYLLLGIGIPSGAPEAVAPSAEPMAG